MHALGIEIKGARMISAAVLVARLSRRVLFFRAFIPTASRRDEARCFWSRQTTLRAF